MTRHRIGSVLSIIVVVGLAVLGCTFSDEALPTTTTEGGQAPSTTEAFAGDPSSRFCDLVRQIFEVRVTGELSGAELQREFDFVAASEAELLSESPDDLRDDVAEFVRGVGELGAALAKVGYDRSLLDSDSFQATSAYAEASTRVHSYHNQVCIDPQAATSAPDSSNGSSG